MTTASMNPTADPAIGVRPTAVDVRGLSKTYPNGTVALRDLTLSVSEGEVFGLDVDEQRFTLEVRDQHLIARHGAPDDPVATLTGRLRDFFAAYRGDQAAASRIAIDGDARAGTRLLTAITDSGTAKSSR